MSNGNIVISSILKHDNKQTSYKIALLRAINDIVLNYPDIQHSGLDIAVPLRLLAQCWVAYYWAFVNQLLPIWQGQRAKSRNDMSFRPQLTELRCCWEKLIGGTSKPSDGFFLINELRIPRKREKYSQLHTIFAQTLTAISKAIEQPIRYAGPGQWSVFAEPVKFVDISSQIVSIPGTLPTDKCLVVKAQLWQSFQELSLWIEALCIHEWCLFIEKIQQDDPGQVNRCFIYCLLTDRPDNRRPLTWEHNQIDLLLIEGKKFICPWTQKQIINGTKYDLDHLIPVSVYPINELWNLIPADPDFNSHTKRDGREANRLRHRLPTLSRLQQAKPHLELAYTHYNTSSKLAKALQEDIGIRFYNIPKEDDLSFSSTLSDAVINLINVVAESRNLVTF